jgi:1-acyl-sn-glycerol-3-phosphate acyltransferase
MDILRSITVWFIGICFMVVLFPVTFIIWLLVFPFDRKRVIIHWLLMHQSFILTRLLPIWRISIEGRNKPEKGTTYVIIANHQSILDILFINSLRYNYKWISKIENMNLPVLGWYLRMAGYITVNRGNEESKIEMLERSLNCLRMGTSIMIFPEGTRSPDRKIGFFKRGAFQLALEANLPVLPVLIDGTGDILPKHGLIFRGNHKIVIRVLEPVLPSQFITNNADELASWFSSMMTSALKELRDNLETR